MKKTIAKAFKLSSFIGFFYLGCLGSANATIINLDAYDNSASNPVKVSLSLNAGVYDVTAIGTADGGLYNAWNAWGYTSGCDSSGASCNNGWLNYYTFSSTELGVQTFGNGIYASPSLALGNAVNSMFTLTSADVVSFYIADRPYYDNLGGMSLDVAERSSVPEPSILALMSLGLFGIGLTRRYKHRQS